MRQDIQQVQKLLKEENLNCWIHVGEMTNARRKKRDLTKETFLKIHMITAFNNDNTRFATICSIYRVF